MYRNNCVIFYFLFAGVERVIRVLLLDDYDSIEVVDWLHVYEKSNIWLTFNVTTAVLLWTQDKTSVQRLILHISSAYTTVGHSGRFEFLMPDSYSDAEEPLLLLYYSTEDVVTLFNQQMSLQHATSLTSSRMNNRTIASRHKRSIDIEDYEEETNVIWENDGQMSARAREATVAGNLSPSRLRRIRNTCRRRPLYVNFADINYDTWIIAPSGYEVR